MNCSRTVMKHVGIVLGVTLVVTGSTAFAVWAGSETTRILHLPDLAGLSVSTLYTAVIYGAFWGIYECRSAR